MDPMEKMRMIIMNSYDIRQLDKQCNQPHCKNKPEICQDITEFTLQKSIGIAKIFLCSSHSPSSQAILKTLRKTFPDIIIQSKESKLA
jgi:hypothetical protein